MTLSGTAQTLAHLLGLDLRPDQDGLRHTPAEIAQQPDTWRRTFALFRQERQRLRGFLQPLLKQSPTVMLIGAGTSDYAGWCVAPLLRRKWGCEVMVTASTDLLTNADDFLLPDRGYLWISFSRSGDSPEGVAVLENALRYHPGVHHLVITCNGKGRMAQLAASSSRALAIVLDDAVNDRGLAMTSSFTNMVVFAQALAHLEDDDYAPVLDALCHAGEVILTTAPIVAQTLASRRRSAVCFVGSGALRSASRESALKTLELTAGRVRTMSESTLGLRHGPMSALNGDTTCVLHLSSDPRRRMFDLDLMQEIHDGQLAGDLVAIGKMDASGLPIASGLADHALGGRELTLLADVYRPPVDVIFGQLLGLFNSLQHGLQPDTPSPQGVISRVVRKFPIY